MRVLPQILVSGHWRRMLVSLVARGKGLGMRFSWDNYEHGGHIYNIMFTFLDLLQLAPAHTLHRHQHCSIRRTINTRFRRVTATLPGQWLKGFSCLNYLDMYKRIGTLGVPNPSYLNRYRVVHQILQPLLIWSRQGEGKLTTCQKMCSYFIKFFSWLNIIPINPARVQWWK